MASHSILSTIRGLRLVDVDVATRATVAGGIPMVILVATGNSSLVPYAAFGALTAIYGRSEPYKIRLRTLAIAGLMLMGTVALGLTLAVTAAPLWIISLALVAVVIGGILIAQIGALMPATALFPAMTMLICAQIQTPSDQFWLRFAITSASVVFAATITMSGWLFRRLPLTSSANLLSSLERVTELQPQSAMNAHVWSVIGLNVAGVLLAGTLAIALNVGHAYWAIVAVIAVMPAPYAPQTLTRGIHRVVGTLAGVGVAAIIFMFEPGPWILVGIWAVCQFMTEILVSQNYGIALVFVTPFVLAITELSSPVSSSVVLTDRVVATMIGAAAGMLLVWLARDPVVGNSTLKS